MSGLRQRRAVRIIELAKQGKTRTEVAEEMLLTYQSVVKYGLEFGIPFRHAATGRIDNDRADVMAAMYAAGKTLEEIGGIYDPFARSIPSAVRTYRREADMSTKIEDGGQDCRTCRHNTYIALADCEWVDCNHPITLAKGPRWEKGDPAFVNMRTSDLPLSRLSEVADCACWEPVAKSGGAS